MTPLRSIAAAALLALSGQAATAQDRPEIMAVNYALQHMAQTLVGDAAEVTFPVPADVDPSFWRPSISDISAVQAADLILLNGAGFATWVDRVSLPRSRLLNTSRAITESYIVTESITHSHGDGGEHSHEGLASYTWLDPTLAAEQAAAIAGAIAQRGIAPAEDVFAALTDLTEALEALDAQTATALAGAAGVPLITTHPRYEYFAARYGLSLTDLEWEAGAAPDAGELAELKATAEETGASILIWEAAPPAEAIAAVEALGLTSVVFEPMAQTPISGDFIAVYEAAVADLAAAIGDRPAN
ncbi:MAG: metal ABC transporter substrate-binding protein [Pseudomonadota bacterium]